MKKSYCPIDTFINVMKGKRKSTIILHLSEGDKRYSELVKLIPDISERMMEKAPLFYTFLKAIKDIVN